MGQENMRRRGKISFWNLWFFSMGAGVIAGTIWANLLGGELLSQIGYFDGLYKSGQIIDEEERRLLWRYVLIQRLWEAGFGGLLAMTPLAAAGYLVLSFAAGFILAAFIAAFTLEKRGGGDSAMVHVRVSPWFVLCGRMGSLAHGGKRKTGTAKDKHMAAGRFPGCGGKFSGGVG